MIKKLLSHIFINVVKRRIYLKISFVLLVLPFSITSQVTFSKTPLDNQLVARNGTKGVVVFEGEVNSAGTPFDDIKIITFRGSTNIKESIYALTYNSGIANFATNNDIDITAELMNYTFEIYGLTDGSSDQLITTVTNVVAGDVYIIQGQSNAVAKKQAGNVSSESYRDFIRVYASADPVFVNLESNDQWYIADGDGAEAKNGNAGQWGRKLASMIIDSKQIPVAIFNGAKGGKVINYFLENYSGSLDLDPTTNNYERLKYRLDKTGLQDAVKAVIWSQGENISNTIDLYKTHFLSIRESWLGDINTPGDGDYPNIEHIYIFQTINGCGAYFESIEKREKLMFSKEAQRLLAKENTDIQIMNTDGLIQYSDDCHFVYTDGYKGFAERIYPLVLRDLYSGTSTENEESPDIVDAYLIDDITLIVETSVTTLSMSNPVQTAANFELANAGGASIIDVSVSGGQIIFTLSSYPGSSATISNLGADPGIQDYLITNTATGPEILSFYEYPISASGITIWNSNSWTNSTPTQSTNAIINDDLTYASANLDTKDLKINSGVTLDFDNGTTNSIVVYGDLAVDGSLIVGDTESLVIDDVNAIVTVDGTFTKKEKTTNLKSRYDVTYWSSPVENTTIGIAFPNVDANRIFYMDPEAENPIYTGTYLKYRHWFIADASNPMTPGMGFSVDGNTIGAYPNEIMEVSFEGKPNYKDISVPINTYSSVVDDSDITNLIGNPYPAAINADQLIQDNSSKFDGTIYLWSHNTDYTSGEYVDADYLTYNLSGSNNSDIGNPYYIASGQGFMILANGNGTFDFKNSIQVISENDQFFKSGENKKNKPVDKKKDRMWLALDKDGTKKKEILIGFTKNASKGIDFGYDGKLLNEDGPLNFYSLIDNEKFVIQGQSSFTRATTINLGFDTKEPTGTFTISIAKIEGKLKNAHIYLEDKVLNITHDLNKSDYTYEQTEAGEILDRFVLKFNNRGPMGRENNRKNNFKVYKTRHGSIAIRSDQTINKVKVYDIYGRLLMVNNVKSKTTELNTGKIRKGTILLIEAVFENGDVIRKKTIEY